MTDEPAMPPDPDEVDSSVPHSARIWNYWLGGTDHYPVDRAAGEQFLAVYPQQRDKARACRRFLVRTVGHLAARAGVRQFLDVGAGLPVLRSTHEVAQSAAPDARVVYVDNDPLVVAHAGRLLRGGSSEGRTSFLDADLHDPESILRAAAGTLDLDEPVALLLIGVLGHVESTGLARALVARFLDGLPRGSYLVQCDGTPTSEAYVAAIEAYRRSGGVPYHLRTAEEIATFHAGLDLVEPGLVPIPQWRPDPGDAGAPREVDQFGGVGRNP